MNENKVIISCPVCRTRTKIPSDKHIRFTCKTCITDLEYDNGDFVSFPDKIDDLSKPSKKGYSTTFILRTLIVVLFLLSGLIVYNMGNNIKDDTSFNSTSMTVPFHPIPNKSELSNQFDEGFALDAPVYDYVLSTSKDSSSTFDKIKNVLETINDIIDAIELLEDNAFHAEAHNKYQYYDKYYKEKGGRYESKWRESERRKAVMKRINTVTKTTRCGCSILL